MSCSSWAVQTARPLGCAWQHSPSPRMRFRARLRAQVPSALQCCHPCARYVSSLHPTVCSDGKAQRDSWPLALITTMHLSNHHCQSAERQSSAPAASLTRPGALEAEACVFSAKRDGLDTTMAPIGLLLLARSEREEEYTLFRPMNACLCNSYSSLNG